MGMTVTRRNVWTLSTAANVWHPTLLAYGQAVRAMQALPITDPRSWAYQSAIHGLAGTAPPPGAPWNECQHATWFFLPWHRMYLFQFEQIVRSFVVNDGGPADWALPYWDYSKPNQNSLPLPFRQRRLPDNTPNPLFVAQRRTGSTNINNGDPVPSSAASSTAAMRATVFTTPSTGSPLGFGGPRTGFAHFGPGPGALENQPHNVMHVVIGGSGGLMSNPDTAASDPIFWLHHANIDRLWETWRLSGRTNPTTQQWLRASYRLRDVNGAAIRMRVADVLDAKAQLDYQYDTAGAPVGAAPAVPPAQGVAVSRRRSKMVARSAAPEPLGRNGLETTITVGDLPAPRRPRRQGFAAAATDADADADETRFQLELADIVGTANPGVVYGVYVNLPAGPTDDDLESHQVGAVSMFGIEHSTPNATGSANQPLRYVFDITGHVTSAGDQIQVSLRPLPGLDAPARGAAPPDLQIGTIAIHAT